MSAPDVKTWCADNGFGCKPYGGAFIVSCLSHGCHSAWKLTDTGGPWPIHLLNHAMGHKPCEHGKSEARLCLKCRDGEA